MAAKNYLNAKVTSDIAKTETAVVIAKTEIPRGTKIGPEHITVERYPIRLLPEGAMVKKDEVIGRVAFLDVPAKTLILDKQLAGLGRNRDCQESQRPACARFRFALTRRAAWPVSSPRKLTLT